jgi:hypothetical protein
MSCLYVDKPIPVNEMRLWFKDGAGITYVVLPIPLCSANTTPCFAHKTTITAADQFITSAGHMYHSEALLLTLLLVVLLASRWRQ